MSEPQQAQAAASTPPRASKRAKGQGQGQGQGQAADGSARTPTHTRQWTHTMPDGVKEQRIHRSPEAEAMVDPAAGAEAEEASAGPAGAAARPRRGRQARRQAPGQAANDGAAAAEAVEVPAAPQAEAAAVPEADDDAGGGVEVEMEDGAASAEAAPSNVEEAAPPAPAVASELSAIITQLHSYTPASIDAAAAASLPPPPFELFAAAVAQLRAAIQTGQTHVQLSNPAEVDVSAYGEHGTDDAAALAAGSSLELRSLLHGTRVHFARCYPLPSTSWLEWAEDVQSMGSGVSDEAALAPEDEEQSAEAVEAREDATAASEQLFLISLFRIALTDYASPQLWDAFLTYMTRAADRVLQGARSLKEFRVLCWQAVYPRGVLPELQRRVADKKAAARAGKEAARAQSGEAGSASTKRKEKEAKEDAMDERSDVEDSSSSSDDDDSSDDDEADDAEEQLWSDDEELDEEDEAATPSPFAQLHPALATLAPLPYSRTAVSPFAALPSPVPVCYSYTHGDALFQKLRGVEMHLLTRMMQEAKRRQDAGEGDDDDDDAQEELMHQIERINRLYRLELSVPVKDLESVYGSYEQWQKQQGSNSVSESITAQYEYTLKIAQTLEKKFEVAWATMEAEGRLLAGVGVLSAEAQDLFTRYVDFLTQSSKSRQRCKTNPAQLWGVMERIVAVAFLDASWWVRFISVAEQFAPRGVEGARYQLEVAQRAWRNCPWDARIGSSYVQALEAMQEADAAVTREAVESAFEAVLNHSALQSNPEGGIELRMQVIGYYRRTVMAKAHPADIAQSDALIVRSHFLAIQRLLPYLAATVLPERASELASRVYQCWVELECVYLHRYLGDGVNEDTHSDVETAARKAGVPLVTYRARQLFQQYADDDDRGSMDARPWLDWASFENRALVYPDASVAPADQDAHVTFIRQLFRQGMDRMTGAASFSIASAAALQSLVPLLQRWLDFELLHSNSLAQLQHTQQRCAKYMDALKALQAQEAQQQQQAWHAAQAQAEAAAAAEAAPSTWLDKAAPRPKSSKAEKAGNGAPGAGKKPKQAKTKSAHVATPAAPVAAGKGDASAVESAAGKKKRKRGAEDADAPNASLTAPDEPSSKKSNSGDAAEAAASAASPEAAPTPVIPAHTVFVTNLLWSLRDAELHTLFAPCGTVVRLVSHKSVGKGKSMRKAYVEATFSSEAECEALEKHLQGKEMHGKKIAVAREPPRDPSDAAPTAAASASAASSHDPSLESDPLSVFVKNLPRDAPNLPELVRAHFADCGEVIKVDIPKQQAQVGAAASSSSGTAPSFKNFCTVVFSAPTAVPLALAKHLSTLGSTVIAVVPNQAPARAKKLAAKMAAETKRRAPGHSASKLAFVPRVAARAQAQQNTQAAQMQETTEAAAAPAAAAPISSNDEFRARLLAGRK